MYEHMYWLECFLSKSLLPNNSVLHEDCNNSFTNSYYNLAINYLSIFISSQKPEATLWIYPPLFFIPQFIFSYWLLKLSYFICCYTFSDYSVYSYWNVNVLFSNCMLRGSPCI